MNAKSQLLRYAQRIAKENFSAYEFSKEFKLDYQNVCKFYRDADKMPIKIAFMILDEMQAKLIVFRAK